MRKVVQAATIALSLAAGPAAAGPQAEEATDLDLPEPVEAGVAPVNGIAMYYRVYGAGDPVLLIHGGLSDADAWNGEIAALAASHTVIVADSRGQGRSTRTDDTITYERMADDYVALMDHLGLDRVALVGWSDGGIIGLEIAIHHPERLTRLFAQAANTIPEGLAEPPVGPDGATAPELRHYDDVRREIEALWANEPHITEDELASIPVETAIVIGENDGTILQEHTAAIARGIPDAKLIVLPGVGHSAPVEDPEGYARAVLDFLGG